MYTPIQTYNPPPPEVYQCCESMQIRLLDKLSLIAFLSLSLPARHKRSVSDYHRMWIVDTVRTGEVPSPKHAKSIIGIAVGWSETVPGIA